MSVQRTSNTKRREFIYLTVIPNSNLSSCSCPCPCAGFPISTAGGPALTPSCCGPLSVTVSHRCFSGQNTYVHRRRRPNLNSWRSGTHTFLLWALVSKCKSPVFLSSEYLHSPPPPFHLQPPPSQPSVPVPHPKALLSAPLSAP